MGLFIGIIIIIVGFIGSLFIKFANGMSDNPSTDFSIWPWLIGCMMTGSLAIFTHYFPFRW